MSYATYDFAESIGASSVLKSDIETVIRAWGLGDGTGGDAGHPRWSENTVTDCRGGFLFRTKDGRYCYLTGWCDYTGWGCQDGISEHWFDTEPTTEQLCSIRESEYDAPPPPIDTWDVEPVDLNRWLASSDEEN